MIKGGLGGFQLLDLIITELKSHTSQWSRYVGAVATKTNSTQASEIDISSIKCLSYMSVHGVVVSTSASHSENRGSIPCKGIFPFFPIF